MTDNDISQEQALKFIKAFMYSSGVLFLLAGLTFLAYPQPLQDFFTLDKVSAFIIAGFIAFMGLMNILLIRFTLKGQNRR